MKSCLKIWGGKGACGMAEWIVSHFPERASYHTFIDAFFGSGAVTLCHDPEGKAEIACDKNLMLTNFWRALQSQATRATLTARLLVTPFSEIEFGEAKVRLAAFRSCDGDDSVDVGAACDFFIVARQSYVGRQDKFAAITKSRVRRGMQEQVSAWMSAIDQMEEVADRLMRILVIGGPFEEKMEKYDRSGILIYCDPPYDPRTRTDPDSYGENDTTAEWHDGFLTRLRSVKHAKLIVSGNPNSRYDEALAGWTRVSRQVADTSSGAKSKRIREEVLWMNY